jgi:hypothetical protein
MSHERLQIALMNTLKMPSSPVLLRDAFSGIAMTAASDQKPQLLHLVFGGELKSLDRMEFANLDGLDIVGIYPNYAAAHAAWKGKAQRTVDNAQMRYFIVHLHRLLDPDATAKKP